MKSAPADRHLLILLTDASPDDSRKILPSGKIPLSRDYDGQTGVDDTAEEVRALRQQGIRVAAVFMGENASRSCGQCHLRPGSGPHPPDGSAGRGGGTADSGRDPGAVRLNDSKRQRGAGSVPLPIFRPARWAFQRLTNFAPGMAKTVSLLKNVPEFLRLF